MRILIAEDDQTLGKFVREGLESEHYKVDVSTDGEQARSAALENDYDVVILDLMIFMKSLDIIFCCNVLIYFDLISKRRVIQHFFNNLLPHGYLFLGHSESLFGVSDEFRLVHLPGATAYVKGDRSKAGKQVL